MLPHSYFKLVVAFFLLSNEYALSTTLVPIHLHGGDHNSRRQERSGLDTLNKESFTWGDPGSTNALATLDVYMPGNNENIFSVERFDGMVTNIECRNSSIGMTFKDNATFAYAQRVWDCVNGADNHSFVMVAGPGDCGDNTDRAPFIVTKLTYDRVANKALLAAKRSDWIDVAYSYDFSFGSVANDGPTKRDISKSSAIDFNHKLAGSIALSKGKLEGKVTCVNCKTVGKFDMQFTIKQTFGNPTGASMRFLPNGVSGSCKNDGSITDALTKTLNILSIPLEAVKIAGILELGPFLTVSIGSEIAKISLSASVTTGATSKLSDSAIMKMDVLKPKDSKFSGWVPTLDILDVTVEGPISGGVAIFLQSSLELEAQALGKGFKIGFNIKAPNVKYTLTATTTSSGACKGKPGKSGVDIATTISAALNAKASKVGDESNPLTTLQLAAIDKTIAEKCFPIKPREM